MQCPTCRQDLTRRPANHGVLVDACENCQGVWLDGGEVYLFSRRPSGLERRLDEVPLEETERDRDCPRCQSKLTGGDYFHCGVEVDHCRKCDGFWFDADELPRVIEHNRREFDLRLDPRVDSEVRSEPEPQTDHRPGQRIEALKAGMLALPNLFLRSVGTLVLLYGILGAALIALVEVGYLGLESAVATLVVILVLQFLFGPWFLDLSLRWFYHTTWLSKEELPDHLREFIERVVTEQKMGFPHVGLIHDRSPNAFTYGHTPRNMRIVITQGILDLLEPEEVEAVVAHEIGHGKHWDMLLMTIAQLVPLLLYAVYRTCIRASRRSGRSSKKGGGGAVVLIAIGAYLLYIISQYIVLWFSRTREYHADRFAGRVTGNPNALAGALMKIAYGLASRGGTASSEDDEQAAREESKNAGRMDALGALGIFDAGAARGLAATAAGTISGNPTQGVDAEGLKNAMQWDLWNPWAKWYELHSTHPLVAHRLQYLADQAASMGQEPYVVFDRHKPESYWDEFFVDFAVMMLPLVTLLLGGVAGWWMVGNVMPDPWMLIGGAVVGLGVGSLLKTMYAYRGGRFVPMTVAALLKKVKVSTVRPVPAQVQGTILGRGVPGLIWSEDFVMQDRTGILFLDYRQPLRIWEFLFGLLRAGDLAGKPFQARGWYRRAPVPYLELREFTIDGKTRRCYVYHVKLGFAALCIIAGLVATLLPVSGG